MIKELDYKGVTLKVSDEGTGIPVVLLHGYLESLEIWKPFSNELKKHFRVFRIDIPGHGGSGMLEDIHSMDLMAQVVRFVLDAHFIDKCVLIGHSMGGYITLAFVENYPERLLGFSLFHSSPFADTDEKKHDRDREIEMVLSGKKDLIFKMNIPKGFADDNLQTLKVEVSRAIDIAQKTPEKGIVAILEGMKTRPDRSEILKSAQVPYLWILGGKDNYIQFETMKPRVEMNHNGELFVLENSGHMGFLEELDESLEKIISFVKKCAE